MYENIEPSIGQWKAAFIRHCDGTDSSCKEITDIDISRCSDEKIEYITEFWSTRLGIDRDVLDTTMCLNLNDTFV